MSKAKLPGLAPEIAAVSVDDASRSRWAWYLPGLVAADPELLDRYRLTRPPSADEAREVRSGYVDALEKAKRRAAVLVGLAVAADGRAVDFEARATVADGRFLDLEAARHRKRAAEARAEQLSYETAARAEVDKVATAGANATIVIAAERSATNQTKEAAERELALRYEVAVPRVSDHDVEASAILAVCTSASRKKPGVHLLLILADLARQQLPIPDRVVEALAAVLGLSQRDAAKRVDGVTWVDEDTPLKVLGYLAGQQPDQKDAALALYDSVLWFRQHGRITPGPLLNGLAAIFGIVDPKTAEVNHTALARATGGTELDALFAVEAYVDVDTPSPRDIERATGVPRETVRRMHEKGHLGALQAQRLDQRVRAARVHESLNDPLAQANAFAAYSGDALARARLLAILPADARVTTEVLDSYRVPRKARAATPGQRRWRAKLEAALADPGVVLEAWERDAVAQVLKETALVAEQATPRRAPGRRSRT